MLKKIIQLFTKSPMQKAIAQEDRVIAHNYKPLPVVLTRGEGVYLWDIDGKKYLDMMSAYSAISLGHAHPRILRALTAQAEKLAVCSRAFHADTLAPFAEKLCAMTGLDMVLPMNTGAEAVETAIKAARLWGYAIKKIPDNQAEIIVADGNFHGRTTTIVGFSSEPGYKKNFGPFTPGFVTTAFGDIAAIEAAITDKTAAILIEPIQGEGGIKTPPEGFLRDLRSLCDRKNILLILDEIQSGLGRTGKMFCFQHDNITPDLLILGKALGGDDAGKPALAAAAHQIGHGAEVVAAARVQPLQQLIGAKRLLAELRQQARQTRSVQVQQVWLDDGAVQGAYGAACAQRVRGQIWSAPKK